MRKIRAGQADSETLEALGLKPEEIASVDAALEEQVKGAEVGQGKTVDPNSHILAQIALALQQQAMVFGGIKEELGKDQAR